MIHVYPLAAAFNGDDEKDDNDDVNENSWIITWQFVFTNKKKQNSRPRVKSGVYTNRYQNNSN